MEVIFFAFYIILKLLQSNVVAHATIFRNRRIITLNIDTAIKKDHTIKINCARINIKPVVFKMSEFYI